MNEVKAPPHDGTPGPRRLVADPAMDTSPTRVDPHNVLEPKVLPECALTHFHGAGHVLPALLADRRALAARPDVVIVRKIDIEHQLS